MKGLFAAPIVVAALASGACNQLGAPTTPSSVSPGIARLAAGDAITASSATPADVPFAGSFAGSASVTPLVAPFGAVVGSGTGRGSHLGLFTVAFPHTVNFVTRTGVGTYTFTAANGDQLTGDFTGQASGVSPLISLEEAITVTGGTGRFAGATGSIAVHRRFNQATGETEGTYEGTISSVGAGKQ